MTVAALIAALGLLVAAEGLIYAAFPVQVRQALAALLALPPERLRVVGLGVAAMGAGLVAAAGFMA